MGQVKIAGIEGFKDRDRRKRGKDASFLSSGQILSGRPESLSNLFFFNQPIISLRFLMYH